VGKMKGRWRGKRGEWFVVAQGALFVLLAIGPRSAPGVAVWSETWKWPALTVGGLLMAAGGIFALYGAFSLGHNLTPLPRPKEEAQLVEDGAYRYVRHPIYCGILFMACGWGFIARSWLTLAYATIVFLFLDVKSRREERWLEEKFPTYPAYKKRVRKLIPFIY